MRTFNVWQILHLGPSKFFKIIQIWIIISSHLTLFTYSVIILEWKISPTTALPLCSKRCWLKIWNCTFSLQTIGSFASTSPTKATTTTFIFKLHRPRSARLLKSGVLGLQPPPSFCTSLIMGNIHSSGTSKRGSLTMVWSTLDLVVLFLLLVLNLRKST